ncbi:acetyltransferase [bacterium]|nr:acetyltransferase [bacterium]
MKSLILIGGGGHCKSVIDVVEQTGLYHIQGILDLADRVGQRVLDHPIIGTDSEIENWVGKAAFLVTIGQIQSPSLREAAYLRLKSQGAEIATVISPSAYVSRHAVIQPGTVVMHHALVNAGVIVGENCIVNTAAVIEHDVWVGEHSHISTGAFLNGDVRVDGRCFIGSGTTMNQGIWVVDGCVIGSGSVVTRSIDVVGTYAGVPARKISEN